MPVTAVDIERQDMSTVKYGAAAIAAISIASAGYALGKAAKPPKGYLVAEVEVTDPQAYKTMPRQLGRSSRRAAASIWRAAARSRGWKALPPPHAS
jgi:hypothetical protein